MTSTGTPPAARPRPRAPGRSFAGLLWALVPVLVVLVGIVLWQQAGEKQPPATVDPTGDIAYARRIAPVPFPALGPVPDGWRATSSRVDAPAGERKTPVTLTIGYVTPAERYAEIVVTDQAPQAVLGQVAAGATADGTTPVGATPLGAASWERYRSPRGETVLMRRIGEASVLVTGDAPDADLATLAGTAR